MNEHAERPGASAVPRGDALARGFPAVALMLALTLAWIVGWYWPTAREIAGIWWRSETFAHGLVVLPISAWLIWSKRARMAGMAVRPIGWMAVPVVAAAFAWLLAEMVNVNALAHASLAAVMVLSAVGVLGWQLARLLAFPLLFLFFGVPFGEFLIPTLMDYTADFTVLALRLSGVPVYREGLFFVVPNGQWSVVEGCSGIRYLIASVMVGTLYAYLNYRSPIRRLLFVGVAVVVPIVANWMRAYLIVMIGYLSDNRLAHGVDHFIYGWAFFGIVILLMFWIGSYWREDQDDARMPAAAPFERAVTPRIGLRLVPLAAVTAAFPLALAYVERPLAAFEIVLQAPAAQGGWTRSDGRIADYLPEFSGYRGKLYQAYRRDDGAEVGLFVAYYANQRPGAELVVWDNRLFIPKQRWTQLTAGPERLPVGEVRRTTLKDASGRIAIWHWYRTNGRTVTSDVIAKGLLALDHLTGQPDDAAFLALVTPVREGEDAARAVVEDFVAAHAREIDAMLARAEARE